jgi:hypothetical protein
VRAHTHTHTHTRNTTTTTTTAHLRVKQVQHTRRVVVKENWVLVREAISLRQCRCSGPRRRSCGQLGKDDCASTRFLLLTGEPRSDQRAVGEDFKRRRVILWVVVVVVAVAAAVVVAAAVAAVVVCGDGDGGGTFRLSKSHLRGQRHKRS